jgi:hypothetical protein
VRIQEVPSNATRVSSSSTRLQPGVGVTGVDPRPHGEAPRVDDPWQRILADLRCSA